MEFFVRKRGFIGPNAMYKEFFRKRSRGGEGGRGRRERDREKFCL
jgi:hypothetical protein